jgi:predicted nucleic acid-binding protein
VNAAFSVIDASVAAKWVMSEAQEDEARAYLRGEAELHAPAIVRIEVTAAILRRYRVGGLTRDLAAEACDAWDNMLTAGVLRLTPDEAVWDDAIGLALAIRHGFRDCLYLALAKRLGAPLVTADAAFLARAAPAYAGLRPLG